MLLCDEWGVLPISDAQDIKLPSHSNDHLTCKLTHLIFQAFCILGALTLYSVDTKHFLQVQCNRVQGEAIKVSASLHHKPWAITVVIVHVNLFLTHTHTHLLLRYSVLFFACGLFLPGNVPIQLLRDLEWRNNYQTARNGSLKPNQTQETGVDSRLEELTNQIHFTCQE